jgi:hypothetical protein
MTKEEIWSKNVAGWQLSMTDKGYRNAMKAMDEYAKQQVIYFNKWQTEQGYVNGFDDAWIKALNGSQVASSTEELYNQFIQQIENK